MMRRHSTPRIVAFLLAFAAPLAPAAAFAAPPHAGQPAAPEVEPEDPEAGVARAAAPDERAWHWLIAARGGLTVPFGSVASEFPATALVAVGPMVGGSLGVGLGRHGVLEASFDYAALSGADRPSATGVPDETQTCAEVIEDPRTIRHKLAVGSICRGSTFQVGLGLAYHLAQGIALDPWTSYGVGYRSFSVDAVLKNELPGNRNSAVYRGLDFARIAIGGDFYPVPSLGFGPYLELDLGTYVDHPLGPAPSLYAFFGLGARVVFDPLRLIHRPSSSTTTARAR